MSIEPTLVGMVILRLNHMATMSSASIATDGKDIVLACFSYKWRLEPRIRQGHDQKRDRRPSCGIEGAPQAFHHDDRRLNTAVIGMVSV